MEQDKKQRHVVSVSIGDSERDHCVETEFLGIPFKVERIGTDGDIGKAIEIIKELDGKVDALGLGGTDLYVYVGSRRYTLRSSLPLVRAATKTPFFDGSTLKLSIEKEMIHQLAEEGVHLNKQSRVLLVSSVDRFGMAESFSACGCETIYGDFMFTLNLNIPVRTIGGLKILAGIIAPIATQLPIEMLYPTGDKQKQRTPKWVKYYQWATIVAGDFHMLHKYMPDDMKGKTIITNTTTARDVEELKSLGAATLITTTPELGGRSFGTNVMEGVYAVILGKTRENPPSVEDFRGLLKKMNLKPRVSKLND